MVIYINQEAYIFEVKTFLKVYYPKEELIFIAQEASNQDYRLIIQDQALDATFFVGGQECYHSAFNPTQIEAMDLSNEPIERRKAYKKLLKHLIYSIEAQRNTTMKQPWGILTGIRPTKVVFKLRQKYGEDTEKIKAVLKNEYKIAEEKILLMLEIAEKERAILNRNQQDEVSIYLGIPFCPTKCLYCSFTSFPIEKWKGQVEHYLEALRHELTFVVREMLRNRPIRSIYIGGGTPTSIGPSELERLMKDIGNVIEIGCIPEFTVEAGRPDTITREKLQILKAYGVNRISINPQTMNQKTLKLIGRNHTVEDIYRSFNEARVVGFDTINMDLIVGLPGETSEDVYQTMEAIKALRPENVTVHTMAIKRGSELIENLGKYIFQDAQMIEDMIKITSEGAKAIGLEPYYLYRQKHMVGNFENVGYAKLGHECIYNVEIMEESQTIFALGAGATTKMVNGSKIERIENVKEVSQYISRVEEMIERKRAGLRDGE